MSSHFHQDIKSCFCKFSKEGINMHWLSHRQISAPFPLTRFPFVSRWHAPRFFRRMVSPAFNIAKLDSSWSINHFCKYGMFAFIVHKLDTLSWKLIISCHFHYSFESYSVSGLKKNPLLVGIVFCSIFQRHWVSLQRLQKNAQELTKSRNYTIQNFCHFFIILL